MGCTVCSQCVNLVWANLEPHQVVGGSGSTRSRCAVLPGEQQPDNLLRVRMGQALHVGDAAGGQRAGEDHQAHPRHAERRGAGMRGAGEGAGEDADGRYASGFGHNRVVETPRCAGASIRNAVDDGVTRLHQGIERLLGARGAVAELGRVDDLFDAVRLLQDGL